MNANDHPAIRTWLCQQLGVHEITLSILPGATSATVFNVQSSAGNHILRVFDSAKWASSTAALTEREALILRTLEPTNILAPQLVARHKDNGVLMSILPGAVKLPVRPGDRWLGSLARELGRIHTTDAPLPWQYESWNNVMGKAAPVWWRDPGLWLEAQRMVDRQPVTPEGLIHRDFHPTNVLWQGPAISGIVDWVNACRGPAAVDVAHCRLNLALLYGQRAADRFLSAYCAIQADFEYAAFWDIDSALGTLPDLRSYPPWQEFGLPAIETVLLRRRLQRFVRLAVAGIRS